MSIYEKYLVSESTAKVGDWIKQERSDAVTYAFVVEVLKNGSLKVLAISTDREVPALQSAKGWYPAPVKTSMSDVPPTLLKKLKTKLSKTKYSNMNMV